MEIRDRDFINEVFRLVNNHLNYEIRDENPMVFHLFLGIFQPGNTWS
jgi:hypothetical protein